MQTYGYSEAMTYSFESPKVFDKLLLAADDAKRDVIRISNPLGEDYSIMRTSLLNGMLTSLSTNYNRRNKSAALYELSNIYIPEELPLTKLPDERMTLCIGAYGEEDFYSVKGMLEDLFDKLGVKRRRAYRNDKDLNFLHPGRQAKVFIGKDEVAFLGELHPKAASNYGLSGRVLIAQVDVQKLYELASFIKKFKEIPKYPAITRDLSLIMKHEVPAADVEAVIEKNAGSLFESLSLFDIYEGEQVGAGYKSLAYSIVFRAKDRTLADAEVADIMDKIIAGLEEKEVRLRS